MKKILSLGIASAVLAMTAISASAVVIRTDSTINPDTEIKVDFVLDADAPDVSFTVVASGLEIVSAEIPGATGFDVVRTDKMGLTKMTGGKAGDTVFTQTYKVTAKTNEAISIAVVADPGATTPMSASPLTINVTAAGTTSNPGTTSSDPGTTSSDPGTTSSDPGTTSGTTSAPGTTDPTNPDTGIALAIFPAVIAGAAVVVAKKKRG